MNTLRTRSITGFFFAAIILAAIYGGEISSILLFGIVILFSSYEISRMLRRNLQDYMMLFTFLGGVVPYILSFYYPVSEIYIHILIYISVLIQITFLGMLFRNIGANMLEKLSPLTSFLYLGITFYLLRIVLLKPPFQWELVLSIILLIWSSDTFAYLIGSQIGRNKLYQKISPGKSWEGFIGAGICNLGVAWLLFYLLNEYTLPFYLCLGFIVWLFGSLGDLFESFLKRHFGIKDSGSFLPGHGGFLDRFDSFIFVIPFVCLLMLIFNLI